MHVALSNTNKKGESYFTFKYRREGKLKTVPRENWSHLNSKNKSDLENYLPVLEARFDHERMIRKRMDSWQDKYHNFQSLLDKYLEHRVEKAPKSWETKESWFKNYVLRFFLNEKHCSNLNSWRVYFIEFKDWLKEQRGIKTKKPLSYQSMNHCITELNVFLEYKLEVSK